MPARPSHGGFLVPANPVAVVRPNRLAAGLTKTIQRTRAITGRGELSTDACTLSVRGTLDRLGAVMRFSVKKHLCPCCNHATGKLVLKPGSFGAQRLARLRTKRAARVA